jgi:hypothetical protein
MEQIWILTGREMLMKTAENVTTVSDGEKKERVKAVCERLAGRDRYREKTAVRTPARYHGLFCVDVINHPWPKSDQH